MKGYLTSKKLGLLILLMVMTLTVSITQAQTKFGIRLGVNTSNVTEKDKSGTEADTQNTAGVVVGLTAQITLEFLRSACTTIFTQRILRLT